VLADVVDRADVGVVETGGGLRFALEPLQRRSVPKSFSGRNFSAT